jgi:hypothetical protein
MSRLRFILFLATFTSSIIMSIKVCSFATGLVAGKTNLFIVKQNLFSLIINFFNKVVFVFPCCEIEYRHIW